VKNCGINASTDFKTVYCSKTEAEFEKNWSSWIAQLDSRAKSYLVRNLYPSRSKWADPWCRLNFNLGIRSTQRSESGHYSMKRMLKRILTLPDLLDHLEKWRRRLEAKSNYLTYDSTRRRTTDVPAFAYLCREKITDFAWRVWRDEVEASQYGQTTSCTRESCCFRANFDLPCRHEIAAGLATSRDALVFDAMNISKRWLLTSSPASSSLKTTGIQDLVASMGETLVHGRIQATLDQLQQEATYRAHSGDPFMTQPKGRPRIPKRLKEKPKTSTKRRLILEDDSE
jgi:hypothetical protein